MDGLGFEHTLLLSEMRVSIREIVSNSSLLPNLLVEDPALSLPKRFCFTLWKKFLFLRICRMDTGDSVPVL